MENNNVDNLISSLPEELQALATKCLEHIAQKKLEIDDAKLNLYINQDTLSRFLTAREGNETKALAMWEQWLEWRLTYKPESIQESDIKNELESGKAFLHGYDKEGRPCIVVKISKHIPAKTDVDEFIKFFMYLIESACKKADEMNAKQICVILDRENSGLSNFDRRFLGKLNFANMLQDYYAERLHKVYILHVNWVFKMIHGIVRPFMSGKTKSKMMIMNQVTDLKTYFSDGNLLKEHGGTSEFIYNYK